MFNIGNISLGKNTKKNFRKNQFDNNTTFCFGAVQPLFKQILLPDSDVTVNMRQLVRLAPMPVPSFGRVKLVNRAVFVPFVDVCPYYESLLAKVPYQGASVTSSTTAYTPTELPRISNRDLMAQVFRFSSATLYVSDAATNSKFTKVITSSEYTYPDKYFQYYLHGTNGTATGSTYQMSYPVNHIDSNVNGYPTLVTDVTSDSADYVLRVPFVDSSGKSRTAIYLWRFSDTAKRLRNIFIGLGYNLDASNYERLNFLPVLAFYKAWFDTYAVQRSQPWETTNCFRLIRLITDYYVPNMQSICNLISTSSGVNAKVADCLSAFFNDLASDCFYTYNDDFVSVHRSSLANNVAKIDNLNVVYTSDSQGSSSLGVQSSVGEQPVYTSSSSIYQIGLQTLQRLTRYVNKDSIIGKKMTDWVRVHFNADVANSLYKNVYNVGASEVPIQINDVWSTSDTAQFDASGAPQSGERLGAYGGKGLAFGDDTIKFHADKHGFLIVLSAVVCDSRYFQGNDTDLYCFDRFTLPDPSFDALGYEVTAKSSILDGNNIADLSQSNIVNTGFGFVPRYTGFKVKKDIINGDMSRRGNVDDLCPYYLDRIITARSFDLTAATGSSVYTSQYKESDVPNASDVWRYMGKYKWLGDSDRIFYNSSSNKGQYVQQETYSAYVANDDNFIVQTLFDMSIRDVLKPISQSFDTFEESTDNASTAVKPE